MGWTPNDTWFTGGYNFVGDGIVLMGDYSVTPIATLSQTFNDVKGATYTVSMWVKADNRGVIDANSIFEGLILLDTFSALSLYALTRAAKEGAGEHIIRCLL
jgi:hypothetical protein